MVAICHGTVRAILVFLTLLVLTAAQAHAAQSALILHNEARFQHGQIFGLTSSTQTYETRDYLFSYTMWLKVEDADSRGVIFDRYYWSQLNSEPYKPENPNNLNAANMQTRIRMTATMAEGTATVTWRLQAAVDQITCTVPTFGSTQWHHYVFQRHRATGLRIIRDGVVVCDARHLIEQVTANPDGLNYLFYFGLNFRAGRTGDVIAIGAPYADSAPNGVDPGVAATSKWAARALLDDFTYWNIPLTVKQVNQFFFLQGQASTPPAWHPNLIAYFPMDSFVGASKITTDQKGGPSIQQKEANNFGTAFGVTADVEAAGRSMLDTNALGLSGLTTGNNHLQLAQAQNLGCQLPSNLTFPFTLELMMKPTLASGDQLAATVQLAPNLANPTAYQTWNTTVMHNNPLNTRLFTYKGDNLEVHVTLNQTRVVYTSLVPPLPAEYFDSGPMGENILDLQVYVLNKHTGANYVVSSYRENIGLTGVWKMVSIVAGANLDAGAQVYIDGDIIESQLAVNVTGWGLPTGFPSGYSTVFGSYQLTRTDNHYIGAIDEFRIWNKALSLTELHSTMNVKIAGVSPSLFAHLNMDNLASGTYLFDTDSSANYTCQLGVGGFGKPSLVTTNSLSSPLFGSRTPNNLVASVSSLNAPCGPSYFTVTFSSTQLTDGSVRIAFAPRGQCPLNAVRTGEATYLGNTTMLVNIAGSIFDAQLCMSIDGASTWQNMEPFRLSIPGLSAANSTTSRTLPSSIVAGTTLREYVFVHDLSGNLSPGCGNSENVTCTISNALDYQHVVIGTRVNLTTYECAFVPTRSGAQKVRAFLNTGLVGNIVTDVTVLPAPLHLPSCTISGLRDYAKHNQVLLDIVARDRFGNLRPKGDDAAEMVAHVGALITGPYAFNASVVFPGGSSDYGVSMNFSMAGAFQLRVVNISDPTVQLQNGAVYNVTVLGAANMTHIAPPLGLVSGGTRVTVYGNNFVNNPSALTLAFTLESRRCSSVEYLSRTAFVCVTPAMGSAGSFSVSVTNNGFINVAAGNGTVTFTSYNTEGLTTFTPVSGATYGGVTVTLTGTGFLGVPEAKCRFGTRLATTTTVVSSTRVLCVSPEQDVGLYNIQFANNGQQYATATDRQYTVVEPFSQQCRTSGELEAGVQERLRLNLPYLPNLAVLQPQNGTGTTTGTTTANNVTQLFDADRCCLKTATNEGFKCGVQFNATAGDVVAQINLPAKAWVNEIVTAWYDPCTNQPVEYFLEQETNGTWSNVVTRITKFTNSASNVTAATCSAIPSDSGSVSLCFDWLATEVYSDKFRVRFNSSQLTDSAGWLFEFEVHGILETKSFGLATDVVQQNSSLVSDDRVAVPPVDVLGTNYKNLSIYNDAVDISSIAVRVYTSAGVDVTATNLTGISSTSERSSGQFRFNTLRLLYPLADTYTFVYTSNNNLTTSFAFNVTSGVATRLVCTPMLLNISSDHTVALSTLNVTVSDAAGNLLLGAVTVNNATVNRTISLNTTHLLQASNWGSGVVAGTFNKTTELGFAEFTDLVLTRPKSDGITRVLRFETSGLTPIDVPVYVGVGEPRSLHASIQGTTYNSEVALLLNPVLVELRDASGSLVVKPGFRVNATASAGYTLSGNDSSVAQGNDVFVHFDGNLVLVKPKVGLVTITFTAAGATSSNVTVSISTGVVAQLVVSMAQRTYASVDVVQLDTAVVTVLDPSDNVIPNIASDVVVNSTTVVMNNVHATVSGGNATLSQLTVLAPTAAEHVLTFHLFHLRTNVSINVTVGPPRTFFVVHPSNFQLTANTAQTTLLANITLRMRDAGRNLLSVGASNTTVQTGNVTLLQGSTVRSDLLRTLGSTVNSTSGQILFDQLALIRPPVGTYTLRVSVLGLQPEGQTTIELTMQSGTPAALNASAASPAVFQAALKVVFAVDVQLVDILGSLVIPSLYTTTQLEFNSSTPAGLGLQSGQRITVNSTSRVARFDNITVVRPLSGTYEVLFRAPFQPALTPVKVTVRVVEGVPYDMEIISAAQAPVRTQASSPLADIQVRIRDPSAQPVVLTNVTVHVYLRALNIASGSSSMATLTGPSMAVSANGVATFSGLALQQPPNGTYALDFVSTGLFNVTQTVTVLRGDAVRFETQFGSTVPSVNSSTVTTLPTFTLVGFDAANLRTDAAQLANVDVQVQLLNSTGTQLSGVTTRTFDGAADSLSFPSLTFASPQVGRYVLRFNSSNQLTISASIDVQIGQPVRLVLAQPQALANLQYPSEVSVLVRSVGVELRDAGGAFTGALDGAVRTVAANVSALHANVLSGTTQVQMINSNATLVNLRLLRPVAGTVYTFSLSSAGLLGVSFNVTIVSGPAHSMVFVSNSSALAYASKATQQLASWTLHARDAGGSFTTVTADTAPVSLSVLNGTETMIAGLRTRNFANGEVVFSMLQLIRPTAGTYSLSFACSGLANVTVALVVSVGPAVRVQYLGGEIVRATVPTVILPPIELGLLDGGDNVVGAFDALSPRSANLTFTNASSLDVLSGTRQRSMVQGNVSFADLTAASPLPGVYILRASVDGVQGVDVTLRITKGPAYSLEASWVAGMATVLPTVASVSVPPVAVITLDSSNTTLGASDTQTRTVYVRLAPPAQSNLLSGTTEYTMVNGAVTVNNVRLLAPTPGTYTLLIESNGLHNTSVHQSITIGPPVSMRLHSTANMTVASETSSPFGPVVLRLYDASNTLATTANGVRVVPSVAAPYSLQDVTAKLSVNGSVTMDTLALRSPTHGQLYVNFTCVDLTHIATVTTNVTVQQGSARTMVASTLRHSYESRVASALSEPVSIETRDASGAFTTLAACANVTVSLQGASVALNGTLTRPVCNGRVNFTDLVLTRPKASVGTYTLVFTSSSLSTTTLDITITVGPAHSMRVTTTRTVYPTTVDTRITTPITASLYDAGGSFVHTKDTGHTVRVSSSSPLLAGVVQANTTNGTVSFEGLTLGTAPRGLYQLDFSSTGLLGDSITLTVVVGQATRFEVTNTSLNATCDVDAVVPLFQIRVVDAAGVPLLLADAQQRQFVLAVVQSAGGVATVLDSGRLDYASAVTVNGAQGSNLVMQAGVLAVQTLRLQRPRVGLHVLQFRGLAGDLQPVRVTVLVNPGNPTRLAVADPTGARAVAYPGDKTQRTPLGAVSLTVVDAGGNVNAANRTTRTYSVAAVSQAGTAASAVVAKNTVSPVLEGTLQLTSATGTATFADLKTGSRVGTYTFRFSATQLIPVDLSVTVREGPPGKIGIQRNASAEYDNKLPMPVQPVLSVFDDAGNAYNGTIVVVVQIAVVDPVSGTTVNSLLDVASSDSTGVVRFTAFQFTGVYGSTYNLRYTATYAVQGGTTVLVDTIELPRAVRVRTCGEVFTNRVPNPDSGGTTCICAPGSALNTDTDTCVLCPVRQYQQKSGQVQCEACPDNSDTGLLTGAASPSQCECSTGFYERGVNAKGERNCTSCEAGANCIKGQGIVPQAGFYRGAGSNTFIECPNKAACTGGVNATCAAGYTGPLCAVCAEGYGRFGNFCAQCGDQGLNIFLTILFLVAALTILGFMVATSSGAKSDLSIVVKIMLNYLQVIAFIGDFQLTWPGPVTDMYQSSSLSLFNLQIHPVDCTFGGIGFFDIFLTYMLLPVVVLSVPILCLTIAFLAVRYYVREDPERRMKYWMRDSASGLVIDDDDDDEMMMAARTGMPRFLSKDSDSNDQPADDKPKKEKKDKDGEAEDEEDDDDEEDSGPRQRTRSQHVPKFERILRAGGVRLTTEQKLEKAEGKMKQWFKDIYAVMVLVTLCLAHPVISKVVFQMFNCITIPGEGTFLISDMRVSCDSDEYLFWRNSFGYIMMFGYSIGMLFVGFGILFRHRKNLNEPEVQNKYRFLYDGYAGKRFYWEVVIMTRKLIVVAIIVSLRTQPLTQLYAGSWMVLGALIIHLYARPFVNQKNTNLETLSLTVTVATLMNGMLYFSDELDDDTRNLLTVVVILLNVGTIVVFGAVLIQNFIAITKRQAAVLKMQELVRQQYLDYKKAQMEQERLRRLAAENGEDDMDTDPSVKRQSTFLGLRRGSIFSSRSRAGSTSSRFSRMFRGDSVAKDLETIAETEAESQAKKNAAANASA